MQHKWNFNGLHLVFLMRHEQKHEHKWVFNKLLSTSYHFLCFFWSYLKTLPGAVTGLEAATNFLEPWKCHHLMTRMHTRVADSHSGSFSKWALRFSLKTIAPSAWGQDQTQTLHLCSGSHCLLVALGACEREGKREKKKKMEYKTEKSQTKPYTVSPFIFIFRKSVRTDGSLICAIKIQFDFMSTLIQVAYS